MDRGSPRRRPLEKNSAKPSCWWIFMWPWGEIDLSSTQRFSTKPPKLCPTMFDLLMQYYRTGWTNLMRFRGTDSGEVKEVKVNFLFLKSYIQKSTWPWHHTSLLEKKNKKNNIHSQVVQYQHWLAGVEASPWNTDTLSILQIAWCSTSGSWLTFFQFNSVIFGYVIVWWVYDCMTPEYFTSVYLTLLKTEGNECVLYIQFNQTYHHHSCSNQVVEAFSRVWYPCFILCRWHYFILSGVSHWVLFFA